MRWGRNIPALGIVCSQEPPREKSSLTAIALDASYLRKNISEAGLLDYARTGLDGDIDGHQLGNYTAYDLAIQKVWLLGLTWGYSPTSGRNNDNTESVAASISCLRVNQIETGSRQFGAGVSSKAKPLRLMGFVFVSIVTFLCS